MANLLINSVLSNTVPKNYVNPPERRSGHAKKVDIPVINLQDETNLTRKIMKASQDFGIFRVINHGIPKEQMNTAMTLYKEFFNLPLEEKGNFPLESDLKKVCRLYTSSYNYDNEEMHYWRDALRAECSPLDECMKFWPPKPENFKEVIGEYINTIKYLRSRILEHLSLGLGLKRNYLGGDLSDAVSLTVNHYPPSPDPSLTLGLPKHVDATVITLIQTGYVPGLQFMKDGQWYDVETTPETFLAIMGSQIEVISNGKLKGLSHRVVSTAEGRYSAIYSICPSLEAIVESAKAILEAENSPANYWSYPYKEFNVKFLGPKPRGKDIDDAIRELLTK